VPRSKGTPSFNPLKQTQVEPGQSKLARDARAKRARSVTEAEWLARHFQLDAYGRLDSSETGVKMAQSDRKAKYERLTGFPVMPPGELARLVEIIATYGLPLASLPSDTAAFVVRRVMLEYWRLNVLRRKAAVPLFTPDELIALLREMNMQVAGLSEMLDPHRKDATNNLLWRWLHGVNKPTGTVALRVNRLIEQHVRRKRTAGAQDGRANYSTNPTTVQRRLRKERSRREGIVQDAPTTLAARSVPESEDAAP
jgi:hypothetical protein